MIATKLIYDGTFDGLLTAVFEIFERRITCFTIQQETEATAALFEDVIEVGTSNERAGRVLNGLYKRLSPLAVERLYIAYLSEAHHREDTIAGYIKHVFNSPMNVEEDYSNSFVMRVWDIVVKMRQERHRMEAFVRFQKLRDDIYYAAIEPDFNVLPLLIKHFKDRYADQKWMIYDLKRKYGIYYDLKDVDFITLEFSGIKSPAKAGEAFDADEPAYQDLWKSYFKNVNIPARKNTKLHLRHIPRRYWKHLTEKF